MTLQRTDEYEIALYHNQDHPTEGPAEAKPVFHRFQAQLERASLGIASAAVATILLLGGLNVVDIVLRNLFQTSIYGLNEINVLLVAIAVSTCIPYAITQDAPIKITFFHRILPPMAGRFVFLAGKLGMTIFLVFLSWRIGVEAQHMYATGKSTVATSIAKAPFYFAMAAAIGIGAFAQLVVMLNDWSLLWRRSGRVGRIGQIVMVALVCLFSIQLAGLLPGHVPDWLVPDNRLILAGLLFALLWAVILLTVPIGAAMCIIGMGGIALLSNSNVMLNVLGSETSRFVTQDAMAVLPLFLLMGSLCSVARIGSDLYRFCFALMGHMRGGLAHASILACAGFGTLTGSSVATQLTIGKIAMTAMRERNYSTELASGTLAAGGTLGQLIPPSSALILYAILTEESVGKLFMGAVLPGILATLLYMATITVWLWIRPGDALKGDRASTRELLASFKAARGMILLLAVVLGGLYLGFFTELEAGAVGATGAFVLALARRTITRANVWQMMGDTTITLGVIYTLIFGVTALSFFFGMSRVPQTFVAWVNGYELAPFTVVLVLVGAYLVLGTVMDGFAMMVISIPVFVPLVTSLGFDPIWWGLITVIAMEAGQISPPFGLNIFVINSIDRSIPLSRVFVGVLPFFISSVIKLALLLAFPALVTWLPSTMN